jgi:hypothetical protein
MLLYMYVLGCGITWPCVDATRRTLSSHLKPPACRMLCRLDALACHAQTQTPLEHTRLMACSPMPVPTRPHPDSRVLSVCECFVGQQARVLAARDHSGAVPLLEGRTAAGSLIIACGTFLPEGVYQMVDIQPGGDMLIDVSDPYAAAVPQKMSGCNTLPQSAAAGHPAGRCTTSVLRVRTCNRVCLCPAAVCWCESHM